VDKVTVAEARERLGAVAVHDEDGDPWAVYVNGHVSLGEFLDAAERTLREDGWGEEDECVWQRLRHGSVYRGYWRNEDAPPGSSFCIVFRLAAEDEDDTYPITALYFYEPLSGGPKGDLVERVEAMEAKQ